MTTFPLSISIFSLSLAAVILGRNLTEAPLLTVPPSSLSENICGPRNSI